MIRSCVFSSLFHNKQTKKTINNMNMRSLFLKKTRKIKIFRISNTKEQADPCLVWFRFSLKLNFFSVFILQTLTKTLYENLSYRHNVFTHYYYYNSSYPILDSRWIKSNLYLSQTYNFINLHLQNWTRAIQIHRNISISYHSLWTTSK